MRIVLLGILILVPLGLALLLLGGALVGIATGHGGADAVVAALIFGGLCAALMRAGRRMLTRKGSLLAVPGVEAVNPRLQRFLTSYVLFLVYVVLAGYAVVILQIDNVRNWLGVVLLILAAGTLKSTLSQARRLRHEGCENGSSGGRASATRRFPAGALGKRLQDHAWLLAGVAALSMSAVLYYSYWGGSRYLGPFDLAGFLGLALALTIAAILRDCARRGSTQAPHARPASCQKPGSPTGM